MNEDGVSKDQIQKLIMPFSSNAQGKQMFNTRTSVLFNNRIAKPIRGGGAAGISSVTTTQSSKDMKRQMME